MYLTWRQVSTHKNVRPTFTFPQLQLCICNEISEIINCNHHHTMLLIIAFYTNIWTSIIDNKNNLLSGLKMSIKWIMIILIKIQEAYSRNIFKRRCLGWCPCVPSFLCWSMWWPSPSGCWGCGAYRTNDNFDTLSQEKIIH